MNAIARLRHPSVLAALTLSLGVFAHAAQAEDYVCFDTNHGDICFDLFAESAPLTVENFLRYVDSGAYDMTLVHRSEPDFVIQGGGFSGEPDDNFIAPISTYPPVVNESSRSNLRGTIAMARTNDPNSATSQWFINLNDNLHLDGSTTTGYTVFGEVVQGMDVVEEIEALHVEDFSDELYDWALSYNVSPYTFVSMPVDAAPNAKEVDLEDFVVVKRAYRVEQPPELLPYQCSTTSPGDTLTEFCGSTVVFPALIEGILYEATIAYVPGREGLVFTVANLVGLTDTGQERATFDGTYLTIPSVRDGARVFVNVKLELTNRSPIELTVKDHTLR